MSEPQPGPGGEVNLVHERLFEYLLDLEIQKALRLQYCVSLICLTPDLPNEQLEEGLVRDIARLAAERLRRTDVSTTLSESSVGLLLPAAEPRILPAILSRAGSVPDPGECLFVRGAQRVSVSAGAGTFPQTAASGKDLLRQATHLMNRARQAGGNRLFLPSETPA